MAYNSLLLKRRKEIHEKIGKAIEELYPDRLEEFYEMLAYHYSRGDNLDKAYQYLKFSGSKATKNHSNWEALRFYKETINILKQMPQTEWNKGEQVKVVLLMHTPIRLLRYPEDSLEILQEGEGLSEELGDKKSAAILRSLIGDYYSSTGNPAMGRKYQENSFEEAKKIQDVGMMALIARGLFFSLMVGGEYRKAGDVVPQVITLIEKTHRESDFLGHYSNPYSVLHGQYGVSMGALGKFEEGERLCDKGLSFAQGMNHLYSLGVVEYCYGSLFVFKGDGENVVNHLQRSIEYFGKSQAFIHLPNTWSHLGYGYYLVGEVNRALRCVEQGLKIQRDTGLAFFLSLHHFYLSLINFGFEEMHKAKSHIEEALSLAQKNNEKQIEGMSWIQMGRIVGKMEGAQPEKAEEYILKGMKILDELKIKPYYAGGYLFLGELYANAGQKERGLDNLKKAESMFQEMGMDYWLSRTRKVLETVQ